MRCYIINLPSETKRLARTKRELATWCPGVMALVPPMSVASEWTDEEFFSVCDSALSWKRFGRDMSRGEVACALSHRAAMEEFLKTDDSCCMIVEDDVLFAPIMPDFLKELEVWIGRYDAKPICVILNQALAVRYWAARKWICGVRRTRPIEAYGATAYVVNRKGASCILAANPKPIAMMSDVWHYYRAHGLSVYGGDAFLAGSYDFDKGDSALAEGRRLVYAESLKRRRKDGFLSACLRTTRMRIRQVWWAVTGVDSSGVTGFIPDEYKQQILRGERK